MRPSVLRLFFWAALAAVLVLSLAPVPAGHMVFSWQDKLEHALAFLALGVLGGLAWPGRTGRLAAGLLAYGALIELAQSMTTHRMGDPWDWLADAAGVGLAMALWRARRAR
ncbi:VanZ family protein [Denitromonas sp.]|uniref:VanZ family protein n=1 Tax=Denitromonas sp. TaxID=2734609 RepID=UPI002B0017AB|nr:VanZ family protein [Denitromonas sp.]